MEKNVVLVRDLFGFQFEPELLDLILEVGEVHHFPPGTSLMEIGDSYTWLPLVLSGVVKVLREDADENELLLYFLEPGDTCVMSFSCCMGKKKSKVRAVTEGEADILLLPVDILDEWMGKYPKWRAYIFDSVRIRMDEFIQAVDALAFMRLEERLSKYLHDRARVLGTKDLKVTHQEIADDLNTSRVVVSRLLKRLESEGQLHIGRSHIELSSF